ncbi:MAG: 1-(5-phosphoribosyl)-5-[(5-phosphoribosylamino)methylideneamino]imidazole-4-carboxamide isomerase [Oscillospiraceae bacterium]|nr:1-(5-phosphoribosyl)-5-[(5-phosphoribosylamino)methylideneamino]imidazole-4-carboxamide isomerase [Oscillospiraceae bacterium]
MTIYPAIDIYEGKAVRLIRGDYEQMTVYSDDPACVAQEFEAKGATALHIVDLAGARDGKPANFDVIKNIIHKTNLAVQVGGGIRNEETINTYLDIGVKRVILGTAAVSTPGFLPKVTNTFGQSIAVSADIKDGLIALKGWTELSDQSAMAFCEAVEEIGVQTLICTDISKDGLLEGTNLELYDTLRKRLKLYIIASGGVSTLEEIKTLSKMGINGAILGKALYTGAIDLAEAIAAAQ